MIKLIATDMDGTFLDNNKQFDPRFIDLFYKLDELGIKFAVASGQQFYKLYQRFVPMSEKMFFVAENGTMIVEGAKLISTNVIDSQKVTEAIKLIKSTNRLIPLVCGTKGCYLEKENFEYLHEVRKYYLSYCVLDSFEEIDDDIIKIAIFDPAYQIQEFGEEITNQLDETLVLVTSGNEWMDIMNKGINKGVSIKFLQEYLNIDETMCAAFGDQMNDFELLSSVKYAFAMDNAVDLIKSIAYKVIGSNEQQAVLDTLETIIVNNGEYK